MTTTDQTTDQCSRCGRPAEPNCCLEPALIECDGETNDLRRCLDCGGSGKRDEPPSKVTAKSLTDDAVREEKSRAMAAWDNTLLGYCNIWLSWSAGHEDKLRAQEAAREIAAAINARKAGR